ncbi:tyrosine-type recombinase/integrase [Enterococcus sp. AZ196]|uniref:tyrosine-type recombinase/integrase n=1 Tax=Enterococcus sp. AZ196 TaxID=2774659 RepID=UPI003D2D1DD9
MLSNEKIKLYTTKGGEKKYVSKNTYIGTYSDGSQKNTTIRGKTRSEVRAKYLKMANEFNPDVRQVEQEIITFNDLYGIWLPQYKKGVKPSTYRGTKMRIEKYVLPDLAVTNLNELNVLALQRYYDGFMENNGTKYYHQILQLISMIIRYGVSIGVLENDPTRYVIKPKIEKKKKERVYLNKEELNRLYKYLDSLDNRYINEVKRTIFRLLPQSGIRISECCALNWNDIDFENGSITISKGFIFTENGWMISNPKNMSSIRSIPIDMKTLQQLKVLRNKQNEYFSKKGQDRDAYVFLSRDGHVLHSASIYDMLKRIVRKLELPDINLHSLRHTHATLLFESGATPKEVQARLGHSSIKTTMDTYTHVGEETGQKTINTLMQYLEE